MRCKWRLILPLICIWKHFLQVLFMYSYYKITCDVHKLCPKWDRRLLGPPFRYSRQSAARSFGCKTNTSGAECHKRTTCFFSPKQCFKKHAPRPHFSKCADLFGVVPLIFRRGRSRRRFSEMPKAWREGTNGSRKNSVPATCGAIGRREITPKSRVRP